jgi:hypothetical protein
MVLIIYGEVLSNAEVARRLYCIHGEISRSPSSLCIHGEFEIRHNLKTPGSSGSEQTENVVKHFKFIKSNLT